MDVTLGSELKLRSDSEYLILATNDCFERHSLVLCQGILWNLHHFLVSFFVFPSPLFSCGRDWLSFPFPMFCVSGFPFPCLCGGFTDPEYHLLFCRNLSLILTAYRSTDPSQEMSRKSISVWMYRCRPLRYFRIRCHSESLILNFVRKVWKLLVYFDTVWSLSWCKMVHFV